MLRFSLSVMQHTKRSIKKILPIEMQQVKVLLTSVELSIVVLNRW